MKKRNVFADRVSWLQDKEACKAAPTLSPKDSGAKNSWCWLHKGWICAIVEKFMTATVAEKISILNIAREKHLGIIFVPSLDNVNTIEERF